MISVGQVIDGKYKILSEIGHGGMSVVYLLVLLTLRTPELAAVIDRVRRR